MPHWDTYPSEYRACEAQAILSAVQAGECVSIVGLSGAGKSNLLGFLAARFSPQKPAPQFVLVDCNRLVSQEPADFFRLVHQSLPGSVFEFSTAPVSAGQELAALEQALALSLRAADLCLLLDRFDLLAQPGRTPTLNALPGNLRALRDAHKYALTFITATRKPLDSINELAELFYNHTIWLGVLSHSDALWSAGWYAQRRGLTWSAAEIEALVMATWGYPSFLRAACEAYAAGASLEASSLAAHPAVQRRVDEFWTDRPERGELEKFGLWGHPFLAVDPGSRIEVQIDSAVFTSKEYLLLAYLQAHPGEVCAKDDLIRAVWPEDKLFEQGIRDDSLAQVVRRLRKKLETDASSPRFLLTVPGRGYRFTP